MKSYFERMNKMQNKLNFTDNAYPNGYHEMLETHIPKECFPDDEEESECYYSLGRLHVVNHIPGYDAY